MLQRNLDGITLRLESQLDGLSPELKADWIIHPCTQALITYLQLAVEAQKTGWANGGFTGASQEETIQLNSSAIGKCEALLDIEENIKIIGGKQEND